MRKNSDWDKSVGRLEPHGDDYAGGLAVISKNPADLKARPSNPRTHAKKQIRQIANSIKAFGFVNPVLIDRENGIIAGHGRVEAAKLLGLGTVPTLCVDHLSPHQIRAYVIADNKLAENAGWDRALLALELKELSIELDITLTGFETPEIDLLFSETEESTSDKADEVPELDKCVPAVSRPGDLWRIGDHAIFCGDSTKAESYATLLGGERAQMVFTDPPYNVQIDGHVCGLGKVQHREFAMASGEMSETEFASFLETVFQNLADFSADGALQFICMDWRHIGEVMSAAEKPFAEFKNLCVWAKTNAGMGSLYRSQHELVFVFKKGSAPHVNNVELGKHGRYRTNVWSYAGINSFGKERDAELAMHPTVKPVALVADAIFDCSKRGSIVLDAFAGSGTTLIAAEKTGRRGFGIELDPFYVDTIVKRFSANFGLKAIHAESGLEFEEMRRLRAIDLERSDDD